MSNIYTLPLHAGNRPHPAASKISAFDDLTDLIIMDRARAGTLDPAIVAALLAAVREPARGAGR